MDGKMCLNVQEAIERGYKQQEEAHLTATAQDVGEYFLKKQEAIRRAGTRRSELLKGIRDGVKPVILLSFAAGLIGDLTGDETYSPVVKKALLEKYGKDALQPSLNGN